jgi:hypothetical protein
MVLRRKADTTGDGHFDRVAQYEEGSERVQTVDENADGVIELVIHLDDEGRRAREEIDRDEDRRAEIQRFFIGGVRVREEEDQTGDGKPNVVTTFDGDTLLGREADTNESGKMDTFIVFRRRTATATARSTPATPSTRKSASLSRSSTRTSTGASRRRTSTRAECS